MKKKYIYSILATAFLAVVAIIFFFPNDIQGDVLMQHDVMQGTANGQEGIAYHEKTGDTTRWTNSLFGGMPNFQIAPSYPANKMLNWIGEAYMLWLPNPANLLFAMMIGFFIMALCMKFKWYEALFGAVAWGFSSYFIILIGAGHIWKFVTLAYIPPTIGGLALIYRRKYLAGVALTALFGALQLNSNHPQMTYYFLFVVLALLLAWLYMAIKEHEMKHFLIGIACMVGAGVVAVAANSASLYNSYEYAKHTVRGRATELSPVKADPSDTDTGGMSRSAITAWSYGVDETLTLLIPNVKGGASIKPVAGENQIMSAIDTPAASQVSLSPEEQQFAYQFTQYFGDQPMTNGPVYVGAFVLLLAILALFVVKSPFKWALFAVSVLAIALSWGHNFPALTNAFIDWMPGYNKFRAVSSILVIVEFTIPLLAMMCVKDMVAHRDKLVRNRYTFFAIFGLGAFVCFVGWLAPSVFGSPFSVSETEYLTEAGAFSNPAFFNVLEAIRSSRLSLVSSDCLRSLVFILLGGLVIWLWMEGKFKKHSVFVFTLTVLALFDLYSVSKRYVDSENFTAPADNETAFKMTPADQEILKDTSNYRVLDVQGFGSARSSYFHKTIGGYHAAKLTRYNDLLDRQISKNNMQVLNMLNAKYFMNGNEYELNPDALGNVWFVEKIDYVSTPDEEMKALDSLNTARAAVADEKFKDMLGQAQIKMPGDTIFETSYAPNHLVYTAKSAKGGLAVFSEIYFPWGWEATIDGKAAEIGRVNYVLRAMHIPAGTHRIEMRFDPQSLKVTNTVGVIAVVLIYVVCAAAIAYWLRIVVARRKNHKLEPHSQSKS